VVAVFYLVYHIARLQTQTLHCNAENSLLSQKAFPRSISVSWVDYTIYDENVKWGRIAIPAVSFRENSEKNTCHSCVKK